MATEETKETDESGMERHQCSICGYIYDPTFGDDDGGIAPGTKWADIPATWGCPLCGGEKSAFFQLDE